MRKALTLILPLFLCACTSGEKFSREVVRSEMDRCPEASFIDGQNGSLKWNYTTGLELKAFLDVFEAYGDEEIFSYVDKWYDGIISEDGTIYKYKKSNYSTDHICPGRTLFSLYDLTGKEKYRYAMDTLYSQIKEQPRTKEGGFWHKAAYPHQMWLDGLYMAQPFYAEYTQRYVSDPAEKKANYEDIVHQFKTVYEYTYDPGTTLLRHAWDSSHEMFWCDPSTGQSAHAWGRALGWFSMALVEVIPFIPEENGRDELVSILGKTIAAVREFADPETGMWYQVIDSPGREGNYLEATCSAMFTYAMLKGTRLGILEGVSRKEAMGTYSKLLDAFVRVDGNGLVNLDSCCEVAGLGGNNNRKGDFDYYIHEPVRSNDPKGIGPLIWAALETEK